VTAHAQPEGATSKTRSAKLPLVVAMLAVLAVAWWVSVRQHTSEAVMKTDAASPNEAKSLVHLESFVVNLADGNQSAFLKVGIDLGVGQTGKKQPVIEKGSLLLSKIRDVILSVLTTCQSADLLAPDGKGRLKQRLLEALKQQIPELPVKDIYFTEFLVQR
jgi:flagellar basal body-associated protein FliL